MNENAESKMGFAPSFTFECITCASGCEMYASPHCEGSRTQYGISHFQKRHKAQRESNSNASVLVQKVRKSIRISRKTTEDRNLDKEGVMYEAGAF